MNHVTPPNHNIFRWFYSVDSSNQCSVSIDDIVSSGVYRIVEIKLFSEICHFWAGFHALTAVSCCLSSFFSVALLFICSVALHHSNCLQTFVFLSLNGNLNIHLNNRKYHHKSLPTSTYNCSSSSLIIILRH